MILVMISAVILTVWKLVPRAVDPLLHDRTGTVPAVWVSRGATRYFAVVALLTGIVAAPFAIAIVLALNPPPKDRTWQRQTVRWLGVAISLACGLALLNYPLDGMRFAYGLRDGSGVAFYHQYRIWPGEDVTSCLELTTPSGRSGPTRLRGIPQTRGRSNSRPTMSRPLSGSSIAPERKSGMAGCGARSIARPANSSAREDLTPPA